MDKGNPTEMQHSMKITNGRYDCTGASTAKSGHDSVSVKHIAEILLWGCVWGGGTSTVPSTEHRSNATGNRHADIYSRHQRYGMRRTARQNGSLFLRES